MSNYLRRNPLSSLMDGEQWRCYPIGQFVTFTDTQPAILAYIGDTSSRSSGWLSSHLSALYIT